MIGLSPSGPGDFFPSKPSRASLILSLLIQSVNVVLISSSLIEFPALYFLRGTSVADGKWVSSSFRRVSPPTSVDQPGVEGLSKTVKLLVDFLFNIFMSLAISFAELIPSIYLCQAFFLSRRHFFL